MQNKVFKMAAVAVIIEAAAALEVKTRLEKQIEASNTINLGQNTLV